MFTKLGFSITHNYFYDYMSKNEKLHEFLLSSKQEIMNLVQIEFSWRMTFQDS